MNKFSYIVSILIALNFQQVHASEIGTVPDADRERLVMACEDTQIAETVFQAFQTHLSSLMLNSPELKTKSYEYIIKNFFKLGSPHYEMQAPFEKDSELSKAFSEFRHEIVLSSKSNFAPLPKASTNLKQRISIITGPYNGGHISPAKALKEELQNDFDVEIIDDWATVCDEVRKEGFNFEPCQYNGTSLIMNGGMDFYSYYHYNWFNIDPYLRAFFQNWSGILRKKVAEFRPDLIISTLHHVTQLTVMSHYMGVPIAIVVTDFGFPFPQWEMMDLIKYPMASYWIPTTEKRFFRQMIQNFKQQGEAFNWTEHPRSQLIKEQLFESKREFIDLLPKLEVFQPTGFPVAKTFEKRISRDEKVDVLEALKMNTDPERKNVALSYGAGVVGSIIKEFLEKLISCQDFIKNKIQLTILTGRNKALHEELEPFLQHKGVPVIISENYNETKNKKFGDKIVARVLPMLSYPADIASFYKVSDLLLSKAGGATTAEIGATGTQYLRAFGLTLWELENIKHLESAGLTVEAKNFLVKEDPLEEDLKFYFSPVEQTEFIDSLNQMLLGKIEIKKDKILPFRREAVRQYIHKSISDHRLLNEKCQNSDSLDFFGNKNLENVCI